jgi:predicted ATPase
LSAVWGQGPRTLRSACEDLSVPDPLGPLYDLARDAQWALPQAIHERQGQRLRLFSDALEIFEAKAGPSLLVIEDLHWADDVLGRRIVNTHILLLLTARTDRSERQMRVRRALGKRARRGAIAGRAALSRRPLDARCGVGVSAQG